MYTTESKEDNTMKISINKQAFRWDEADKAIARLNELKNDCDPFTKDEQERMMVFYTDCAFQARIHEFKATIAKNGNPLMPSSGDYDATIDCWVEIFVEAFDACYRIGFYLFDFWMLDDENRDEIKRRAYIRKFAAVD